MPKQIEDADYEAMSRAVALLQKLNASPKARTHLERAVKAEFPDVVTAEEQADLVARPYIDKIEALEKKLTDKFDAQEARERKAAEEAADNELIGSFMRLKSNGYTDEGLEKIAGLMKERKIADPEAAAALFDRLNPKPPEAAPSSWEPARWDISSNAVTDTKALFENEDRWADQEVGKVLHEVRTAHAA